MRVVWFYVFDLESDRAEPIGAWMLQVPGGLDYVFDPAYPNDEEIASDLVNRMVEAGKVLEFGPDEMEYWRHRLGYLRAAGELMDEDVSDYADFFRQLSLIVGSPRS